MLCISLTAGEYFTINDDIVVKLDHVYASRSQMTIHAPREMPIIRGKLLERNGGKRPDCIKDVPHRPRNQLPWDAGKARALRKVRTVLEAMGSTPGADALRSELAYIFPKEWERATKRQPKQTS